MKFKALAIIFVALLVLGCAQVQVKAPKEPIKVDVTMRLDVYQHVTKDIDDIENMVSGQSSQAVGPQSRIIGLVGTAYAEGGLSPDVEEAAMRRRDRRGQIVSLQSQGVLGENKSGLLVVRKSGTGSAEELAASENRDRITTYKGIAEKNGTSVGEVQKLYAKRLQKDAPAGTPIEVVDASTGKFSWIAK